MRPVVLVGVVKASRGAAISDAKVEFTRPQVYRPRRARRHVGAAEGKRVPRGAGNVLGGPPIPVMRGLPNQRGTRGAAVGMVSRYRPRPVVAYGRIRKKAGHVWQAVVPEVELDLARPGYVSLGAEPREVVRVRRRQQAAWKRRGRLAVAAAASVARCRCKAGRNGNGCGRRPDHC